MKRTPPLRHRLGGRHLVPLVIGAILAPASLGARPNFVFILADDLGWCDLGTGKTNSGRPNRFVDTPAVARLAAEGIAFTNAYTAGPNCAPTRAALLTGRYGPHPSNNVFNVGNLNRGPRDTLLVGPKQGLPSGKDAIPNDAVTYAEVLQRSGYRTAHFGKFHVAERGSGPTDIVRHHGFSENFGGNHRGSPKRYHARGGRFGPNIEPGLDRFASDYTRDYLEAHVHPVSTGVTAEAVGRLEGSAKHVSDALAEAAIDFMRRSEGAPFLVQFNAYAVHTPIGPEQARADLLRKYRERAGGRAAGQAASFAALIEGLDQGVARLVKFLETTPDPTSPGRTLAENTVVFFYSDNGGKLPQSNNGPLRGQKGELYEGGVRVPLIAWSGSGRLVAGPRICGTPVTSVDFLPTLGSLAGVDLADDSHDGADLSPLLGPVAAPLGRDAVFWHFPGYLVGGQRDQRPTSAIRAGPWKLLYRYEDQSVELYNLDADVGETSNLASEEPALVQELSAQLLDWLAESEAPLATLRQGEAEIEIDGAYYAAQRVSEHTGKKRIVGGDEMPFVRLPVDP